MKFKRKKGRGAEHARRNSSVRVFGVSVGVRGMMISLVYGLTNLDSNTRTRLDGEGQLVPHEIFVTRFLDRTVLDCPHPERDPDRD